MLIIFHAGTEKGTAAEGVKEIIGPRGLVIDGKSTSLWLA
jgi:hypothetical protein